MRRHCGLRVCTSDPDAIPHMKRRVAMFKSRLFKYTRQTRLLLPTLSRQMLDRGVRDRAIGVPSVVLLRERRSTRLRLGMARRCQMAVLRWPLALPVAAVRLFTKLGLA